MGQNFRNFHNQIIVFIQMRAEPKSLMTMERLIDLVVLDQAHGTFL